MKKKIVLYLLIYILVIGFLTTGVIATDLSILKGTGSSRIGQVFPLSVANLVGNPDMYCIQHNKTFRGQVNFILKDYVEIDGNQSTIYRSANDPNPKVVNSNYNGQVAYILSKRQGYGTVGNHPEAQLSLWHITNNWTTEIFGDYTYSWNLNTLVGSTQMNTEAEQYAINIGNQKSSMQDNTEETKLKVEDKTDNDSIAILNVGEYTRVGPFRWDFEGVLQSIKVISNKGDISNEDVRFVKYNGKVANIVEVSEISSGEAFYVDVKQDNKIEKIKKLELHTKGEENPTDKIYTAKIWFFHTAANQNIIYTDVGEGKPYIPEGDGSGEYDVKFGLDIGIVKVDDRNENIPLKNVGFKFKAKVNRYVEVGSHKEMVDKDGDGVKETETIVKDKDWKWVYRYLGKDLKWSVETEDKAEIFYTNDEGKINITETTGENIDPGKLRAIEVSNPYYGYDIGKEYEVNQIHEVTKMPNHQERVKLSGYVWLDEHSQKTTIRNNEYDSTAEHQEKGVNEIPVYLKDKDGRQIAKTTTSELGLYSEIEGGEYQFVDVDLDELQAGNYYVEFEYCGIDYQSVDVNVNKNNGSKASDTETREILDNKFTSVDTTGTQSLNINDVKVNYNNVNENYESTIESHTGCNVYARTNDKTARYNLYSGFTPTSEEIRYVNLGIFKKVQTDYALTQDLHNVKVDVNGLSHIYKYQKVRYNEDGSVNEESSWNLGVKFQKNTGTYSRAIYTADAEYEQPDGKDDKEIKVYVTYKIALKNESTYLARINNIVDYCDPRVELIKAGTTIDPNTFEISGDINSDNISKSEYNEKYSKYTLNINSDVNSGEIKNIYLQFKLDRDVVLTIINNGELINNVAEITSYTTFKDGELISVIDKDSVPGNAIPGQVNTYEDDTDAARSLKLELKNARAIQGTVFVDSTGKDDEVYTNQERIGDGVYTEGEETTIGGILVTLTETSGSNKVYTTKTIESEGKYGFKLVQNEDGTLYYEPEQYNEDNKSEYAYVSSGNLQKGDFLISNYIPGKYVLTYTWGDKTYKVQYYKGTIYDETRKQDNPYWYRGSEYNDDTISIEERKTDAMDSSSIREAIDNEMEALKYNTLENEINKAYEEGSDYISITKMESTTPGMEFSVEYETTITDGTIDQVRFTIRNVDFGIVERPKQQLEFSKRISGFKITLANGSILVDAEITEQGELKGEHKNTTYMGPTSTFEINTNGIVRSEVDSEIIQGATLELTYTMKVTNISELDYTSDRYYYYGNKTDAEPIKNSIIGLIDYVDGRLSVLDDKWTEVDTQYLNDVNAKEKDNESYLVSNRIYLTDKLAKELAPNESNEVTLHTSKLLTSTDDNTFNNQSEIVEIMKNDGFNTGTPVKALKDEEADKFYYDFDYSETAVIIPSTGENKSYELPIIIGISTLIILGAGIFVIKKFVINNK